jgi:PAS domain S-box-containing protein
MYGYSAAEAIGRHISFLVPADHKDEEKVILERVLRGERPGGSGGRPLPRPVRA